MNTSYAIATYRTIERELRKLKQTDLEPMHAISPLPLNVLLARAAKIYRAVRLGVVLFSEFPVLSPALRHAIGAFIEAFDAVVSALNTTPMMATADTTDPLPTSPDFKAGKDL